MAFNDITDAIEGNAKTIIITSLVMLLFIVCISALVFFNSLKTADQVLVPNIQGKKLEHALLELQVKELYPRIQLRFSEDYDSAGKILEQDPPAGSIVKAGKRINLTVSRGAVIDRVENYVGKTLTDVQMHFASLFTAGQKQLLTIKTPPMYKFSAVPAGTILEQSPLPDTKISDSVEMNFVISKGPEIETVSVPNLENAGLEDIYSAMQNGKLNFNINYEIDNTIKNPIVINQNIPYESMVEAYSKIDLTIKFPPNSEKKVCGIFSSTIPKYPYPINVVLDAVYIDGTRQELVNFKHAGGKCDIPYSLQEGTVLVLTVLNKQVQAFEVKNIEKN